ncbi:MAG: diaminopimelate decarboxylase [Gammaproteobacteria bacterium]|nr:MAG: diaminopimelate decarboxylase [Gammaproteobacteria bacterium]
MTEAFPRQHNSLHAEQVSLETLAQQHGTPLYVYSRAAIESAAQAWLSALGERGRLCYAVKANSNLAVLNLLARLGAGFDIVSIGELERVLRAGGRADRVVFSGVAKEAHEMRRALQAGIHCFNVESAAELALLDEVAGECGTTAPVSLRVNPDVDAQTHPYISTGLRENKFGVPMDNAFALYQQAAQLPNLRIAGIDCHIGSQLTRIAPYLDALDRVLALVDQLAAAGITLQHLDIGGGLGVRYRDETPPSPQDLLAAVYDRLGNRPQTIMVEPGRSIVANAGVLLTRVVYLKDNGDKHFALVDAAMNDLVRPSLYDAWMDIEAVTPRHGNTQCYDIVGPVCETGDFLGKERRLALEAGDLLAVRSAGAYGFVMSSNYNTRPRAAEILVDGANAYVVRRRETLDDLLRGETVLPA